MPVAPCASQAARRGGSREEPDQFWQNEPKIPLINQFRQLGAIPSLLGPISDQIDFPTGQTQTVTQCHEGTASNPQKPTETVSETASVSIGGSSNDQFIFKPGIGSDAIAGSETERKLSNMITSPRLKPCSNRDRSSLATPMARR
jgi:hypothetical protein